MANPWRLKKEYGGGMLNDWATHLVDQVLVIAGVLSCRVEASNNHRIPLPRWSVVGAKGTFHVRGEETDSWSSGELRSEFHGVRAGGPLPITREEAFAVMRVIDSIRESAALGRSVVL